MMAQRDKSAVNRLAGLEETISVGPKILLTDTNRWQVAARLMIELSRMGCKVAAVCPTPGHPIQKTSGVQRIFHYSGFHPLSSLRTAIEEFDPDLVVPSCDRGVLHLHELHAHSQSQGASDEKIAALIERSLGPPESFRIVSSRYELLQVAQSEGILVPDTVSIKDLADLKSGSVKFAFPWMIKADGTWGGRGVRVAHSPMEAERHFLELTQRAGVLELIKRLMLNRDRGWVFTDWNRSHPAVVAQALVSGRPANCAVVCWQGKVLAGIGVEVIKAQGPKGPATVVQVVENSAMMLAAEKIARSLRLSGFFGLDFMIENGTGAAYLIEMNPRCTPPCPLPLGKGHDLVAGLWAQLAGQPLPESQPVTSKSRIAYFPQVQSEATDLQDAAPLDTGYYDIPNAEPALIEELLHPWSARSLLGRMFDRARRFLKQGHPPPDFAFEGPMRFVGGEATVGARVSEAKESSDRTQ
jgi:hypothetical protein